MKKFVVFLIVVYILGIVVCFYIGQFMIAYGLIFLSIFIIGLINQIYSIDHEIYLHKKISESEQKSKKHKN